MHVLSHLSDHAVNLSNLALLFIIECIHIYIALVLPFVMLDNLRCKERRRFFLEFLVLTGGRLVIYWRFDDGL